MYLRAELPSEGAIVVGDPAQITQILTNLSLNAMEAVEGKRRRDHRYSQRRRGAGNLGIKVFPVRMEAKGGKLCVSLCFRYRPRDG